jgi:flagellum-specific peptidoglycan hydrolase FlgJ
MRLIIVLLFLSLNLHGKALAPDLRGVPEKHAKFIKKYWETFVAERVIHGVPAAISMAQAILESDAGTSYMAQTSNNHFGIKAWGNELTRTYATGKKLYSEGYFCTYKSAWWSIRHHSKLLKNERYGSIWTKYGLNYKSAAYQLKIRGYAEDKNYPQKLIRLIEQYKLYYADGLTQPVKNPDVKI